MSISIDSIMQKVNAWAESDVGKKRIAETIKAYQDGKDPHVNSTGKTYGGSQILTRKDFKKLAKEFISILRSTAASCDLPASVMEHVESFDCSEPYTEPDGSTAIMIYMTDDPRRPSLYLKKHPDGVENIVAHLNCGYEARGIAYGMWHSKWSASLSERKGTWFIQQAAKQFEALYKDKYGIAVEINPEYFGKSGQ